MRLFQSLSFRLALIYAGLFSLSVAALLALFYWISVSRPLDAVRDQVRGEAEAAARAYILDGTAALAPQLEARARSLSGTMPFHLLLDRDGKVVSTNLPSWPAYAGERWIRIEADIYRDGDESDHEALLWDRRFADGARLLIGRDVEDIDEIEEHLAAAATWILAGTLLLGLLGGLQMSRAIGRRIDAITVAARTVIAGDLSGRVAVHGSGDDFDRLGETLNLMLSRIEELVESVRRVSDSVAHELRTPLARLLVELEELAEERDEDRRHALSEQAIAEARRLHRLFDALLRIARIESGRHAANVRPVDLSKLVDDAVELHQPDAEDRAIRLTVTATSAGTRAGDPDLLFQTVSNLIDNALKYTPSGGTVEVGLAKENGTTILSVTDSGIGIPVEERERLTERFYRAVNARGRPGEGLGLSFVAAVAALHRAELLFRDADPGTRVELRFPDV